MNRVKKYSTLSVHHTRPLWSFALDMVCERMYHGDKFSLIADDRKSFYPLWNNPDNLIAVCADCHEKLETEAYKYWKKKLGDKYFPHLSFNYKGAYKLFKKFPTAIKEA